ncbi:acyl-CoA dehydrogenase family protein [Occultella gossypii]|uniref:Acyl-CoA dehydrogenase family protein n=1 Tax=Occultella gossypii TaxID=2800820 RepID=A0ABS7SD56_9MICO|nr:acyl-CoA dehydrogenase [Occultella gossypii]MBZ2198287.1 acyl-CoA dehydrogenase family protein [Occultella gossypii]
MSSTAKPTTPARLQFDTAVVADLVDGRWAHIRREMREWMLDERFRKIEGQPYREHRARVLEQAKLLVEHGLVQRAFPARLGGSDDPGGNIAGFEELVVGDPSLQIKGGVQWGLFAAAILHLGTDHHHDTFLPGAMDLTVPGCFAMTEIGHGSDVAELATTATYDPQTEEFVINTPFRGAWKDYIGNAGEHGTAAVVFAQLITGGVNHGVHAFYTPIRATNEDGTTGDFLPGVQGEDDGLKGGLNGVDNGRLAFENVRIPRTNLMNRYGDVTPEGEYSSPIDSPGRRFFTMLGTLVQGRVSLGGSSVAVSKMALATAIRYGNERRQFTGADDTVETVIMDYQQHQRRLLPLLARTYAAQFTHNQLLQRFHEVFSGEFDTDSDRQDLETLAAASKPLSTWLAMETIQTAREASGGAGYMAENKLVGLHQDMDVYTTFEGDNTVLLQLVGKRLLTDYGRSMAKMDVAGAVRYVADRAVDMTLHRTPLRRAAQSIQDWGSKARSAGELRDPEAQRELLEDRVETMIEGIATSLRAAKGASPEVGAELFNDNQHELIEAARAHGELLQWEAFTEALARIEDPDTRQVLTWLRDLFGLVTIEKNLSWYLIHGRISTQRAATVTSYINRLLPRLRVHAGDLVEAFGYTDKHIGATIGTGVEAERQAEAREYKREQRASGNEPVTEKALRAKEKAERKTKVNA